MFSQFCIIRIDQRADFNRLLPLVKVMQLERSLFFDPANVGDAIEPSFKGRSASVQCGGSLRVSLHIDESQRITDAKFRAAGCSLMVAAASALTQLVEGKTTGEAASMVSSGLDPARSDTEFLAQLGIGANERTECVALACDALIAAIRDYSDSVRDEWNEDEALICTCFGVSETRIESEIQLNSLTTIADVTKACNAGAGCRSCYPLIQDILDSIANMDTMKIVNGG